QDWQDWQVVQDAHITKNEKIIYAFRGNNHIRTMHALFIQTNLFLDSKMSDRMNQAVSKGMVNRRNSFYT
ncbi:MAG: hypothetical protein PHH94_06165, partial [Sphaerochaetaceae bacterium]|nr:hypothetical protein [Sphaerochaetaceae bacterium]